jgi:hypothetical protein
MNIQVSKVIEDNEPQYTIQMDHQSFCMLQGLLCLANNTIPAYNPKTNSGLSRADELLLRSLDHKMMEARALNPIT